MEIYREKLSKEPKCLTVTIQRKIELMVLLLEDPGEQITNKSDRIDQIGKHAYYSTYFGRIPDRADPCNY
jgi:hypothetical protein